MENLFLTLLNMSLTAGWMILAVLLLRLLFRKAPKVITLSLWLLVGLRLVLPFFPESPLSLVPSAHPVPREIALSQRPAIESGLSWVDGAVNPILDAHLSPAVGNSVNPLQVVTAVVSALWAAGVLAMLLYALVSTLRLRRRVAASVAVEPGVFICDDIDTPFLLGLFRPRIYLPSALDEDAKACVLAHEKAHRRNGDHWLKPLAFAILAVHWMNPLVWVAYILLCRDLELFCDERVIRAMDEAERKTYSRVLLDCSAPHRSLTACPVAFGETSVKARVKAVLNYKRPRFWIIAAAVLAAVAAAVLLLTNPLSSGHVRHKEPGIRVGDIEVWPPEGLTITEREDGFTAGFGDEPAGNVFQVLIHAQDPDKRIPLTSQEFVDWVTADGETLSENWVSSQLVRSADRFRRVTVDETIKIDGVPALHTCIEMEVGDESMWLDWVSFLVDGAQYEINSMWTENAPQELAEAIQQASKDIRINK